MRVIIICDDTINWAEFFISAISAGTIFSSSPNDDEKVQDFTSDGVATPPGQRLAIPEKPYYRKGERKRCGRKRGGEIVGTHENSAANRTWRDSVPQFVRIKLLIESLVRALHRCSSQQGKRGMFLLRRKHIVT